MLNTPMANTLRYFIQLITMTTAQLLITYVGLNITLITIAIIIKR